MYKGSRQEFCIKTCPSEDVNKLENTLNGMSKQGWELYSLHESECASGMQYNCIFVKDVLTADDFEDFEDISGFKSKMEKMLYSKEEPYELCLGFQKKIREKRQKIEDIKHFLESAKDDERTVLNEEISKEIDILNSLKKQLQNLLNPSKMTANLGEERLSINLSEEIYCLNDPNIEKNLLSETVKTRQELTQELGYIIPKVLFVENSSLEPYEFTINVHSIPVVHSKAYPEHLMYFEEDLTLKKFPKGSVRVKDFITGRNIVWIPRKLTADFWASGIEPSEYISVYLKYFSIRHVFEIFNYSDINRYIEIVSENNAFLVDSILGEYISISELKYIFCQLIREKVSIKDIIYIFEKINDFSDDSTKIDLLDKIRMALARQISYSLATIDKEILGYEIDSTTIAQIEKQIQNFEDEESAVVKIDGSKFNKLIKSIEKLADVEGVVLVAPQHLRQVLFALVSQLFIDIPIICHEEVSSDYNLKIEGKI